MKGDPSLFVNYRQISLLPAISKVLEKINKMDTNEIPLNIFLDLSKAFDTVDHTILNYYGLKGSTLNVIVT